jgi:hypothetical protein
VAEEAYEHAAPYDLYANHWGEIGMDAPPLAHTPRASPSARPPPGPRVVPMQGIASPCPVRVHWHPGHGHPGHVGDGVGGHAWHSQELGGFSIDESGPYTPAAGVGDEERSGRGANRSGSMNRSASMLLNGTGRALSGEELLQRGFKVRVCACARACVCVCVRVRERACVQRAVVRDTRSRAHLHALHACARYQHAAAGTRD